MILDSLIEAHVVVVGPSLESLLCCSWLPSKGKLSDVCVAAIEE